MASQNPILTESKMANLERERPHLGRDASRGVSPRRRRRAIVVLVGALLGAVAILSVGADRLRPSLPRLRNPLRSESTDRSKPALLKTVRDLGQYHAASGHFEIIVDLEEKQRNIPLFLKGERTLFVASGDVDAGVEFAGLGEEAIDVSEDRRSVTVRLPHARLFEARVDPKESYVFARQRGIVDRLASLFQDSPTSEREVYILAEEKLVAAAQEASLTDRAERNTTAMLRSLFRSLGFTDVTILYDGVADPSSKTSPSPPEGTPGT